MDESLEARLGEMLRSRNLKLATAESCTGGLISDRITNIPGSSDYFLGGVVSYAYEAKVKLLGVSWDTLHEYGAVSRETVLEMACGVRQVLGADIGLAVSGIAGPAGGLPHKPVGTTWIGLSSAAVENAWLFLFRGERREVKEKASTQAIQLLIDHLAGLVMTGRRSKTTLLPIEVHSQVDPNGQLQPQEFISDTVIYPVASTGRRWRDPEG